LERKLREMSRLIEEERARSRQVEIENKKMAAI
jgi:hypothetical protein